MQDFNSLDPMAYAGAVVLLDIDGTLVPDGESAMGGDTAEHVRKFQKVSDVYLTSNGSAERTVAFASTLGVHFLAGHKKPSKVLVREIPHKERVVIGDKFLIDGVFAWRIKATFVKVTRLYSGREGYTTRSMYSIDDVAYRVFQYVRLLRPSHWIKNALVFAPLFFGGSALSVSAASKVGIAFILFSTIASIVYVFNDIQDKEADALHPQKRMRPLPSQEVSVLEAWGLMAILFGAALFLMQYIPELWWVAATFLVLNGVYSVKAKHVVVVDVVSVASSHVLRVVAGGVAAGAFASPWIVLCTFFGALFLVTGKRRAELRHVEKRKVLRAYSETSLNSMLTLSAGLAIISYGIYSVIGAHGDYVVFSTVFVVVALLRVLNIFMNGAPIGEFPERAVIKDPVVLLSFLFWVAYMAILIYTNPQ